MRRLIAAVALLGAATLFPSAAIAAEPGIAPAWTISVVAYPTAFEPGSAYSNSSQTGPGYQLQVFNVGGKATEGEFKIVDTLPASLKPSALRGPDGLYGREGHRTDMSCSVSGHTVTCTSDASVPLQAGEQANVVIPLEVEANAAATVLDKAAVEGGGATPLTTTQATKVSSEISPFGFLNGPGGLFGSLTNADGSPTTQAGSHPYQATIAGFYWNVYRDPNGISTQLASGGGVHEVLAELPRGEVVNPGAAPHCTEAQLHNGATGCPTESQVGTAALTISLTGDFGTGASIVPLFNMAAPPGYPAELAFEVVEGLYIHLLGQVSADGSFQLSAKAADIPAIKTIGGVRTTLWGDPSAESHDAQRIPCVYAAGGGGLCPAEPTHKAFVTMPSSCGGPIITTAHADSWAEPGNFVTRSYESTDLAGHKVGVSGCNQLQFEPTIESKPTTNLADSPSGLDFDLKQPQNESSQALSTAALKDTTVTLPAGMALNPSAGAGRDGCSSAQIRLASPIGAEPIRFKEEKAACPDAAKIGSVEVKTPLLEDPLQGSVYLAKPFDNPFGTLLGIYLVIEDEQTGVIAKLPGKVEADPTTGQLTTTFKESPELPLEDVKLHLFNGPRAALTTPATCGEYTTTASLTPWSTPEGATVQEADSFATTVSPNGGTCPTSASAAENHPAFSAGTISPQAGAYSPFVLKLSREDGTQRLAGIDTTLPKGLTGKLAGVAQCSEAGIAQALGRTHNGDGALEKQSPSCPASSEVGTADVAAGSGITPIHVGAHAYLSGPYKGAPLSVVVITPAVAGPFDLGVVTTRVALYVDPETARIHAVSDPLPQILDGIPLDLRSVSLELGRPNFTLNPTSCDPSSVLGSATSALGGSAALSSPFQVGGCNSLPFKPNLAISIKGATKRGGHPALKAVATAKPGEANIGRVSVALPPTEFLDQGNIKTICTKVQFSANACPAASIYGKATAITPLLDSPLQGPVYLRSSTHKLPDLVVALKGPASQPIEVVLAGKVDTFHKGLRNTFEAVPDAPVTKFVLEMQGGPKKGLIENSANICKANNKATVLMDGQNGKVRDFEPVLKTSCGGKGRKGGKKGHKRH